MKQDDLGLGRDLDEGLVAPHLRSVRAFERKSARLNEQDVAAAARLITKENGSGGYLVFSRAQESFARDYQLYPSYALRAFEGAVAHSTRFKLVYDQPAARVYQLVP